MTIAAAAADLGGVEPLEERQCRPGHLWRVFDSTCDGLYRFILFRVGGNRDVADDLIQQTCCIAAKKRSIPADDARCEAWLRGIARNQLRKHWRQSRDGRQGARLEDADLMHQLARDLESSPLPPDVLAKKELREQLLLAVTSLSSAEQQVLFAFYFEGRSHADIAEERGDSAKGIEARLYRARNRLRAILRDPERID